MEILKRSHFQAAKRILAYVKGAEEARILHEQVIVVKLTRYMGIGQGR